MNPLALIEGLVQPLVGDKGNTTNRGNSAQFTALWYFTSPRKQKAPLNNLFFVFLYCAVVVNL